MVNKRDAQSITHEGRNLHHSSRFGALRLLLAGFVCALVVVAAVSATSANVRLNIAATPEAIEVDEVLAEPAMTPTGEAVTSPSDENSEPLESPGEDNAVQASPGENRTPAGEDEPASVRTTTTSGGPLEPLATPAVITVAANAPAREFIRINMTYPDGKNKVSGTFTDEPLKGCTFEGTVTAGFVNVNYRITGKVTVTCSDPMRSTFVLNLNLSYPNDKIKNENAVYPAGNISVVANSGTGQFAGINAGTMKVESQIFPTDKGGKKISSYSTGSRLRRIKRHRYPEAARDLDVFPEIDLGL